MLCTYSFSLLSDFDFKCTTIFMQPSCKEDYFPRNFHFVFTCMALMALRIASTVTPTSAKTASHMFATPKAPSNNIMNFTPMAKKMFCMTIFNVLRATDIPSATAMRLSFINMTSEASIAASLPANPMAMPTSASFNTGASLIPSPIKAIVYSGCSLRNSSTILTLSVGSNSA